MKRYTKESTLLIALLLTAAFIGMVVYPTTYKLGMSWDEACALAKPEELKLQSTSLETEGVPKNVLEKQIAYWAYDSHRGVLVELNYQKTIIKVQRWKYCGIDFAALFNKWRNP